MSRSGSSSSVPRQQVRVTPAYSYLSDKLRRLSAGSLQCSLFCGGRNCKYESGRRWAEQDIALRGIFSHWVTPNILAMARPSTHLIRTANLVAELKQCGIGSVINLQLPGEHAKCGPGLEQSSGFTYCPEDFMNNGVFFYNYGWKDYGVPTVHSILDMVKVMDFALGEGKVAIHCHAGLGRTGVLIACYLAYSLRVSGPEAVAMVREKRPGSIQTRPQIEVVHDFAAFLPPLWVFFPSDHTSSGLSHADHTPSHSDHTPSHSDHTPAMRLEDLIHNQMLVLHGPKTESIKNIPKVIYEVCGRLEKLSLANSATGSCDAAQLLRTLESWCTGGDSRDNQQQKAQAIKAEVNSSLQWNLLHSEPSPSPLLHLLSLFLTSLKAPVLSSGDDITMILSKPPAVVPDPVLSECVVATVSLVADALGGVLRGAIKATPISDAVMSTDGVCEAVAGKLAADLHQHPATNSGAELCGDVRKTSGTLTKYWKLTLY